MALALVPSTPQEVPTLEWKGGRYIFKPEKAHYHNIVNPADILKTQQGYIVRHCLVRPDGNLVAHVDERNCHIPIIMTPTGDFGALSVNGVKEMVSDIVRTLIAKVSMGTVPYTSNLIPKK